MPTFTSPNYRVLYRRYIRLVRVCSAWARSNKAFSTSITFSPYFPTSRLPYSSSTSSLPPHGYKGPQTSQYPPMETISRLTEAKIKKRKKRKRRKDRATDRQTGRGGGIPPSYTSILPPPCFNTRLNLQVDCSGSSDMQMTPAGK